jgi:hypothetical protein
MGRLLQVCRSDRQGELGEGCREAQAGWGVGGEFVVAAAEVLHERVAAGDHGDVSRWLDGPLEDRDLVHAPVGCSIFPYELQQPTRHEAEQRFTDIRYWNEPQIGGHFPAWEQPSLFAREIEAFFTPLR